MKVDHMTNQFQYNYKDHGFKLSINLYQKIFLMSNKKMNTIYIAKS